MLPSSWFFASENQNEKKHSLTILEKAKQVLKDSGIKLRSVIPDSQYSDNKIRMTAETVISYPANQKRGVNDLLRVDKKFRTYGQKTRRMSTTKGRT
jgi:transposase